MQSVFKLPLGAAVAGRGRRRAADAGRGRHRSSDKDLSPPCSPIADAWPGAHDLHGRRAARRRGQRQRQHRRRRPDEADRRPGRGDRLAAAPRTSRRSASTATSASCSRRPRHGLVPARLEGRPAFDAALATVPPARAGGRHARLPGRPARHRHAARHAGLPVQMLDAGELLSAGLHPAAADHHGADAARRRAAEGRPARQGAASPTRPARRRPTRASTPANNDVGIFTLRRPAAATPSPPS